MYTAAVICIGLLCMEHFFRMPLFSNQFEPAYCVVINKHSTDQPYCDTVFISNYMYFSNFTLQIDLITVQWMYTCMLCVCVFVGSHHSESDPLCSVLRLHGKKESGIQANQSPSRRNSYPAGANVL